jgi:hypothetical protein
VEERSLHNLHDPSQLWIHHWSMLQSIYILQVEVSSKNFFFEGDLNQVLLDSPLLADPRIPQYHQTRNFDQVLLASPLL